MKIYLNGKYVKKADARVSVFDHGLLYGDGVFEGIRSYNRLVFKLKEHVDRLYDGAAAIKIKIPLSKSRLTRAITNTLKRNKLRDAYIRVVVTRGTGDLGLDPKKCTGKPAVIIITDKITLYPRKMYNNGMEIITVKTIRNHPDALNPKVKSLNYLNNILAKIQASKAGYLEAIMLDFKGNVSECTGDNIFYVRNNVLNTPSEGILHGITRDAVFQLARKLKMKVRRRTMTLKQVYAADEVFLTGTAAEIIPIVKVDRRRIADGRPGAVTEKMMEMFHLATKTDGVKY